MKVTGYALIVIGIFLALFTITYNLTTDVNTVDNAGPLNAARTGGYYWFALIPALLSAAIGVWLVMSRHRGYAETYDLRRQQSS